MPIPAASSAAEALHVIKRIDEGVPLYFSPKVGANFGSPGNGWAKDVIDAKIFDTEQLAKTFIDTAILAHLRPYCTAVMLSKEAR